MQIPFSGSVLSLAFIISSGIFASFLLVLQRNNPLANRFLGLLLLIFSLWLLDSFFNSAHIYQQNPNFYFLPIYYSLGFGPLVYFYTQSIVRRDFRFSRKNYGHFLPVLIQACFYLWLPFQDYPYRRWFWLEVHRPYTYPLEFILTLVSLLIYGFLSLRLVRQYQGWIKNYYSEVSRINLRWLATVLSMILLLTSLWLLDLVSRLLFEYYPEHGFSEIAMGVILLILAAGGLLQRNLESIGLQATQLDSESPENLNPELLSLIGSAMEKAASQPHARIFCRKAQPNAPGSLPPHQPGPWN